MSMCISLCGVDAATIEAVLADPPLIWRIIAPDDMEAYESARRASRPFIHRLFRLKGPEQPPPRALPQPSSVTDLDKAWHGIHYLLTGTAWGGEPPLNFLLCGRAEVGSIDVGYGVARALTVRDIKLINEALFPLDEDELRHRFDPEEMMSLKIYPEIWDRDADEDDTMGYCLEFYQELKRFIAETAAVNNGAIVYLS